MAGWLLSLAILTAGAAATVSPAAAAPATPLRAEVQTRAAALPEQNPRPAGTRTLYLIRHGQYHEDDPRDAAVGKDLTDLGRDQARIVGERLAALPDSMTALFMSPLTRARRTAEIVQQAMRYLDLKTEPDLAECTPPTYREDIMKTLEPGQADSCRIRLDRIVARFLTPTSGPDSREVLVCHGNVIRYFVVKALGVDPKAWMGMMLAHCGITVIRVQPNGVPRLISFNDVGHIPVDMLTYTGTRRPQVAGKRGK
jgi:serine/threonine-protein phosphatase PGAM5